MLQSLQHEPDVKEEEEGDPGRKASCGSGDEVRGCTACALQTSSRVFRV